MGLLDIIEVRRIGGKSLIPVNVRIIAATNKDIERLAHENGFRADLLYRLNTFTIHIPPLRSRKNDVIPLTYFFVDSLSQDYGVKTMPKIMPRDINRLISYDWPGNIRELKSVLERGFVRWLAGSSRNHIEIALPDDSAQKIRPDNAAAESKDGAGTFPPLEEVTLRHVKKALFMRGGKIYGKKGAAALLKIHPNTLKSYMLTHDLN